MRKIKVEKGVVRISGDQITVEINRTKSAGVRLRQSWKPLLDATDTRLVFDCNPVIITNWEQCGLEPQP